MGVKFGNIVDLQIKEDGTKAETLRNSWGDEILLNNFTQKVYFHGKIKSEGCGVRESLALLASQSNPRVNLVRVDGY